MCQTLDWDLGHITLSPSCLVLSYVKWGRGKLMLPRTVVCGQFPQPMQKLGNVKVCIRKSIQPYYSHLTK
jgi:hypothetical protein